MLNQKFNVYNLYIAIVSLSVIFLISGCKTAKNILGTFGYRGEKQALSEEAIAKLNYLDGCCSSQGGIAGYYLYSNEIYCKNQEISTTCKHQ